MEMFARFEELGKPKEIMHYRGRFIDLGEENRVGLRKDSLSGEPTLDVRIIYVPEVTKLKFE